MSYPEDILAKVREIPHILVFDTQVPDEASVPIIPGSDEVHPYVTVDFGGDVSAPKRFKGVTGARDDIAEADVVVQCIASTPGDSRKLLNLVKNKLMGYTPPGGHGELRHALYGGTGKVSGLGNPTRFGSVQVFSLFVNPEYA